MQTYLNLSGQSNISKYEHGGDYIVVEFKTPAKDGSKTYKYSYNSAGQGNVEHMKHLAETGSGLNSFIRTNVPDDYEMKW